MNPLAALISGQTGTPATGGSGVSAAGSLETSLFAQMLNIGPETGLPLAEGLLADPQAALAALAQPTGQPNVLQNAEELPFPFLDAPAVDPNLLSVRSGPQTVDVAPADTLPDLDISETPLPEGVLTGLPGNPDAAVETSSVPAAPTEPAVPAGPVVPAAPAVAAEPAVPAGPATPAGSDKPGDTANPVLPAVPAVPAASAQPATPAGINKPDAGPQKAGNPIPAQTGNGPAPNSAASADNAVPAPAQGDRGLPPQQPAAAPAARPDAKPQQAGEASGRTGKPAPTPPSGDATSQREATRPTALPPQPATAATILNPVAGQALLRGHEQPDTGTTSPVSIGAATTGAQVRAAVATHAPQAPQVPVNALAVHIAQQAQNGVKRFDIRLDPPELGRLEIRLDVTREGQVTTHLVVERAETLDLLQRDARALERSLQNAGLDTSEGGLKFSLKDQGLAHDTPQDGNHANTRSDGNNEADEIPAESDNTAGVAANYVATSGLDIRI